MAPSQLAAIQQPRSRLKSPHSVPSRCPTLNFDVLLNISAFSPTKRSLFRLMKTCRTLYHSGTPLLLSFDEPIRTPPQLTSFARFMLTDTNTSRDIRFGYLSRLHIDFSPNVIWDNDLECLFASVLQHADQLEDLFLSPAHRLIKLGHPVFQALRVLPHLRKLTLGSARRESLDLIKAIRAPVQQLRVNFDIFQLQECDPLPVLANIGATLTTLTLKHAYPRSVKVRDRCLKLRALRICPLRAFRLIPVVNAFPNLDQLTLDNLPNDGYPWASTSQLDDIRTTNIIALDAMNSWPSLVYLRGDAMRLYSLGLRCPVTYVDMEMITEPITERACMTIEDMQPTTLRLAFLVEEFTHTGFEQALSQLACSSASLSNLWLSLDMSRSPYKINDLLVSKLLLVCTHISIRRFVPS